MSKLMQRLLTFFLGVPLVILMAMIDFANHFILHIAIVAASSFAAFEIHSILKHKLPIQPRSLLMAATVFIPIIAALSSIFDRSPAWISLALIMSLLTSFTYEVFSPENSVSFKDVISRISSSTFSIVYGGFLLTYVSQLTVLENSKVFIALFFLLVFFCDSFAWLFGMLFGKGNRGFLKVSQNKSVAGFIGGIVGSICTGLGMYLFFPDIFLYNPAYVILTALCVSIAAIAGDLVESAIKRSGELKDSGSLVPGRGGLLDSIDSILFAAPIYFILISFLFV